MITRGGSRQYPCHARGRPHSRVFRAATGQQETHEIQHPFRPVSRPAIHGICRSGNRCLAADPTSSTSMPMIIARTACTRWAPLQTPHLDTLVERGMTFTHCYTMGSMVGAVCLPSRTMMLTGRSWLRIPKAPARQPTPAIRRPSLPSVHRARPATRPCTSARAATNLPPGIQAFDTNIIDGRPARRSGAASQPAATPTRRSSFSRARARTTGPSTSTSRRPCRTTRARPRRNSQALRPPRRCRSRPRSCRSTRGTTAR